MSTTDKHIREAVESFVKELETLIRQAAVAAVADTLGVGAGSSSPHLAAAAGARRRGRPAKSTLAAKAAPAAKASSAPKPGRPASAPAARGSKGKRIRRTIKELDAIGVRIHEYIAKNPGQRAEQIKKALRLGANDWALPIKKLVDERQLTTKGQKRSTTYSSK